MASQGWSLDAVVANLAGDEELARQLVALFVDDCPRMLAAIHTAMATGRPDAVRRAAHAFKGSVSNFTLDGPAVTARTLEFHAASGRLDGAADLIARLELEVEELLRGMADFA
jgi:two-component system sensor histidine kinase/response regulator